MTARLGRWRWRCALCIEFGFAETRRQADDDLERHYQKTHMTKESK